MLIRDKEYEIVKDSGDMIKTLDFNEIVTDYYDNFDYIVGDFAYGKVRLKGFYDGDNKNRKDHNDINNVDEYITNKCAYGCKYFILKKIKNTEGKD